MIIMDKQKENDVFCQNEQKRQEIISLVDGDPRVRIFLGSQKLPQDDVRICRNHFVYSLYIDGRYLLFHLLTRQILLVEPEMIGWFIGDRTFPVGILADEDVKFFWTNWFLVPEYEKESRTWAQVRKLLELKEEIPPGISHYVILPTTFCNARCIYCFEQGMTYQHMSPETVEDTIRFIQEHRPSQGKIHIHWFGGEPTCAPGIMDRISADLAEAGIEFAAEMTSNGSLFTPGMARHARETWKVEKIQVTLDGLAEEYIARKRYVADVMNPFETVIRNIRHLIAVGIQVTIRLNVDEDNIGEIFRTAKFLREFYTEEERNNLNVYAHSLFGSPGEDQGRCTASGGLEELETVVLQINEYLIRIGLMKKDLGELLRLKTRACLAAAPEYNVLIDAIGDLFACDAMPENMRYGSVKQGIDPVLWKEVSRSCKLEAHCDGCVFLPQCTEFNRCPTRFAFDACRRQEKRKLDSDLRLMYYFWRELQVRRTAGGTETENSKSIRYPNLEEEFGTLK